MVNGLVNSLIVYAIQLWGIGATKSQLRMVQTLQNQAGKWALGVGRRSSTHKVLQKLNWLSVKQLTAFHSLSLLWQPCRGKSDFVTDNLRWEQSRTQGTDRLGTDPYRMEYRRKSWKPKTIAWWNQLPESLRIQRSSVRFKRELKMWIKENLSIK